MDSTQLGSAGVPSGVARRAPRDAISPALKSWIDNVIVPALVDEYVSKHTPSISDGVYRSDLTANELDSAQRAA